MMEKRRSMEVASKSLESMEEQKGMEENRRKEN